MFQTIFTICTLFKLKKLKRFLNITEYKIFLIKGFLREAAKKSSSTSGRATKRGGGGKGRAIKEKIPFFETFFFILLPFKNKNYITLDNLTKYGHITLRFVGRYFYLVVTIFSEKIGLF